MSGGGHSKREDRCLIEGEALRELGDKDGRGEGVLLEPSVCGLPAETKGSSIGEDTVALLEVVNALTNGLNSASS